MNDAGTEHAHDLIDEHGVVFQSQFFGKLYIVESWCGMAFGVDHKVHQQNAFEADVRLRYAHPGGSQSIQGIDFGTLPDLFLHLAPVAAAFFHGACLPAVLDLAPFLVGGVVAEAALIGFLVHLGAADMLAAPHDVYRGLLAAHQLTDDLVHEAFFEHCGKSFRSFH